MTTLRQYLLAESKTGRGTAKNIKGERYKLAGIKTKSAYTQKVAPILLGAADRAIREQTAFRAGLDFIIYDLQKKMEKSGVAFGGDRKDILSTEVTDLDCTKASLSWAIKDEQNAQFTFVCHATATSTLYNSEYDEEELLNGKVEHYLKFVISRGVARILTFDTTWKNQ